MNKENIENKIRRIRKLLEQNEKMTERFMQESHSILECGQQLGLILNQSSSIIYELDDLLHNVLNGEVCDATEAASSNVDGNIK